MGAFGYTPDEKHVVDSVITQGVGFHRSVPISSASGGTAFVGRQAICHPRLLRVCDDLFLEMISL
jgi:hypothetical protein